MCIKTKAKKSVTITITIAIMLFSCNAWEDYKVRYKDSIRPVEIENVARKNMFPSPVNADYAHRAEQKQQTNGQTKFIINF